MGVKNDLGIHYRLPSEKPSKKFTKEAYVTEKQERYALASHVKNILLDAEEVWIHNDNKVPHKPRIVYLQNFKDGLSAVTANVESDMLDIYTWQKV